jgi:hypothetical protein
LKLNIKKRIKPMSGKKQTKADLIAQLKDCREAILVWKGTAGRESDRVITLTTENNRLKLEAEEHANKISGLTLSNNGLVKDRAAAEVERANLKTRIADLERSNMRLQDSANVASVTIASQAEEISARRADYIRYKAELVRLREMEAKIEYPSQREQRMRREDQLMALAVAGVSSYSDATGVAKFCKDVHAQLLAPDAPVVPKVADPENALGVMGFSFKCKSDTYDEARKINLAMVGFCQAVQDRLIAKADVGRRAWNSPLSFDSEIITRRLSALVKNISDGAWGEPKMLVDVAAYAMFLWYRTVMLEPGTDGPKCKRCSSVKTRLLAPGGSVPRYQCLKCGRVFDESQDSDFRPTCTWVKVPISRNEWNTSCGHGNVVADFVAGKECQFCHKPVEIAPTLPLKDQKQNDRIGYNPSVTPS